MGKVSVTIGAENKTDGPLADAGKKVTSFTDRVKAMGAGMRNALGAGGGADAGKKVGQFAYELGKAESSAEALGATLKGLQEVGGLGAFATAGLGLAGAWVMGFTKAQEEIKKTDEEATKFTETLKRINQFGNLAEVTKGFEDVTKKIEEASKRREEIGKGGWESVKGFIFGSGVDEVKTLNKALAGFTAEQESGIKRIVDLKGAEIAILRAELSGQKEAVDSAKLENDLAKIKGEIEIKYTGALKDRLLQLFEVEASLKREKAAIDECAASEEEHAKVTAERAKADAEIAKAQADEVAKERASAEAAHANLNARKDAEAALAQANETALETQIRLQNELQELEAKGREGAWFGFKNADKLATEVANKKLELLNAEKKVTDEIATKAKERAQSEKDTTTELKRQKAEADKLNRDKQEANIEKKGMTGAEKRAARKAASEAKRRRARGERGDRRETADMVDELIADGKSPEEIERLKRERGFDDNEGKPLVAPGESARQNGQIMTMDEITARKNQITRGRLSSKEKEAMRQGGGAKRDAGRDLMGVGKLMLKSLSGMESVMTRLEQGVQFFNG